MRLAIVLLAALSLSGIGKPYAGFQGTGAAAPGVQLDAGFPKSKTAQGTLSGGNNVTTDNFSTTGVRRIVVTVAWNSFDTEGYPLTVAWNGGTPANASALSQHGANMGSTGYTVTGIWSATTTGDLTNVSVSVTRTGTASANDSVAIAVYSFSNVGSMGTVSEDNNPGLTAKSYLRTLTTQATGSYVVVTTCGGGGSDETAAPNQTAVNSAQVVGADWVKNAYTTTSNTSTTVGWGYPSATASWFGVTAIEIKP